MRAIALDAHHLSEHPSPARQRLEAWTALQRAAERLDGGGTAAAEGSAAAEAGWRLVALGALERFWARPGKHQVTHLVEALESGDLAAFARAVYRAAGLLALDPVRAGAHESDHEGPAAADARLRATVLMVDDLPPAGNGSSLRSWPISQCPATTSPTTWWWSGASRRRSSRSPSTARSKRVWCATPSRHAQSWTCPTRRFHCGPLTTTAAPRDGASRSRD